MSETVRRVTFLRVEWEDHEPGVEPDWAYVLRMGGVDAGQALSSPAELLLSKLLREGVIEADHASRAGSAAWGMPASYCDLSANEVALIARLAPPPATPTEENEE